MEWAQPETVLGHAIYNSSDSDMRAPAHTRVNLSETPLAPEQLWGSAEGYRQGWTQSLFGSVPQENETT